MQNAFYINLYPTPISKALPVTQAVHVWYLLITLH